MPEKYRGLIISLLIAVLATALTIPSITSGHQWGDDYAGYLLQALAIDTGDLKAELNLNRSLLDETPVQLGPYAYPWGFPTLLWLWSKIVGLDIYRLKLLQLGAIFISAIAIFFVSRFYLPISLSVVAVSFVVFQPWFNGFSDNILSDIPFLAISSTTIYMIELYHRKLLHCKPSLFFSFAVALCCIVAFSFRSNGAFLVAAQLSMSLGLFIQHPDYRKNILFSAAIFTMFCFSLLLLYFITFPDGSLVHANYLTFSVSSLITKLRETFWSLQSLLPIYPFHGFVAAIITIAICVFAVIGIYIGRPYSLGMLVWSTLNLALILSYKYHGGTRYALPLLMPIAIFTIAGASKAIGGRVSMNLPAKVISSSLILIIMAGVYVYKADLCKWPSIKNSYSQEMESVVTFTKQNIPENSKVAFFRPRAFRLLTGRPAIIVNNPDQLNRVEYYVFNKNIEDSIAQIKLEFLESKAGPTRIYENSHYVIFKINGV